MYKHGRWSCFNKSRVTGEVYWREGEGEKRRERGEKRESGRRREEGGVIEERKKKEAF